MMNDHIRQRQLDNPFKFKHIKNLQGENQLNGNQPCVVMAAPGMLQNGLSRRLFDRWCEDSNNGVVLAGYSVEGTLAKDITYQVSG